MLRCILYTAAIELLAFPLGRPVPKSWFSETRFPFRHHEAENRLYARLKVRRWQKKLPDMSRIAPNLMPPKNLSGDFRARLPLMIRETCVAELTHALLCVLGFFCLFLWKGVGGLVFSLLCFAANFPYILIQRYNRPRLVRLLETMSREEPPARQEVGNDRTLYPSMEEKQ